MCKIKDTYNDFGVISINCIDCINHLHKYVEIKCQLDATEVFIADLIACSTCFRRYYAHRQELKSIIQWLLPVVFHAVVFKLLVWCVAEGYVSSLQDAGLPASCKPDHWDRLELIVDTLILLKTEIRCVVMSPCFMFRKSHV